jgi:hypothetical protein
MSYSNQTPPPSTHKRYTPPESCIGCPDLSKETSRCVNDEIYPECMPNCPCGSCIVKGICEDPCDLILNFGKECYETRTR